ncbi:MAG TPA: surface-adhesin E family protein [Burkholderiales bacterium]|nr:surface-adhesin E family protein [Burkholderiales bacterium]
MRTHRSQWFGAAGLLWLCASGAWCQTETPYERSIKQQQLYDLQQQNARQQRQLEQQQRDQQWQESGQQSQARQNAAQAQGREVLQTWQKRPPLAPERNPLLGRWNSQGSGAPDRAPANGDMAALASALVGGLTSGMCDSMLGRGLIEFRPDALVAIGPGGREQLKYHAEYRGGGSRVVVLPKDAASFTHMIIDFNGPDRAKVAAVGCSLARAGGATTGSTGGGSAVKARLPAKWEMMGTSQDNGGVVSYVDRSTIRKSGTMVQMLELWDFKSARTFEGKQFLSVRNEFQYDCASTRRRLLSTRGFTQHMGQGAVIAASDAPLAWERIPAGSLFIEHWKTACAKS